jgi:murein L,D-transpeptidase YafK
VNAHTGSAILVHGGCASIGCFAITNPVNDEIDKLVLHSIEAGQAYVPIHVFPFRMTSENFNRYDVPQWRDFWRNLKEGYDLFQRTHRPPRVSVCDSSYVFAAVNRIEAANPGPIGACPATEAMLRKSDNLKSRVADQKTTPPATAATIASTDGKATPASVKANLVSRLSCSPMLASCRKYATLRDERAKIEAIATEEERIGANRSFVHRNRHTATRSDYASSASESE